jgi:hypothetical protein
VCECSKIIDENNIVYSLLRIGALNDEFDKFVTNYDSTQYKTLGIPSVRFPSFQKPGKPGKTAITMETWETQMPNC